MADKEKEDNPSGKDGSSKPAEVKVGIWVWVVMIAVVVILSGSGFVLGRLLAGSSSSEAANALPENVSPPSASPEKTAHGKASEESAKAGSESTLANQGIWYYNDLESVVVNPDEPGATRFIRVGLILEMSEESNQEITRELISSKTPVLINWLNLYFKSLALSEMENEKDLNRILSQICDAFNGILFPEAKPQIEKILIREFNIQ